MELFLQFVIVVGLMVAACGGVFWVGRQIVKAWSNWIAAPFPAPVELTEEERYFA